jgi:hypothetical protein
MLGAHTLKSLTTQTSSRALPPTAHQHTNIQTQEARTLINTKPRLFTHRFEDYQANVKSAAAAPPPTPQPFGQPAAPSNPFAPAAPG